MSIARLFTLSFTLLAALLVRAQEPQPVSTGEKAFFIDLKKAVVNNDRAWVADHVLLPLRARLGDQKKLITTREEFLQDYDQIMTLLVVSAVHKQSSETLVKTKRGVMIGDGEMWFAADFEGEPPAGTIPSEVRYVIIAIGS
jgi:hypothetical protein